MRRRVSSSVLVRAIREMLFMAQGGCCAYCGDRMLAVNHSDDSATLEHIIPLSVGGTWEISNLVAVHQRCNYERNDQTIIKLLSDPRNARELKVVPRFGER